MKIGNHLKVWRAKLDITQEELGKAVELSRQTIHSIERGKFVPSVHSALKIAAFFKTTVEKIFYLNKEKKDEN